MITQGRAHCHTKLCYVLIKENSPKTLDVYQNREIINPKSNFEKTSATKQLRTGKNTVERLKVFDFNDLQCSFGPLPSF